MNSLLKEAAFGKIQSAINLNEEGVLAECKAADGNLFSPSAAFSFSPFRFDGTEVESQSAQVLFTGKGFDGRALLGIIQGSDKGEKARAIYAYSACVRQALLEGRALPANGAGGVLYKQTKNKISLLFLPQNIFDFAARNANEEDFAALQGLWQDKNLKGPRALAFVRAALIYQTLSGSLPFPAIKLEERQADILDARYLPLKNMVNGINPKLDQSVSYALEYGSGAFEEKLKSSGFSQGQEEGKIEWLDKDFPLEELAAELGLSPDGSVRGVKRKSQVSQKEFEETAKKLLQKKSARAAASRTLRRNRALFVAGIFLIAASLFFARSVHKDKMGRPTTISLSAGETAEVFFSGLHNMDTISMQAASKGSEARSYVDSTSNLYVASKMRDAFSQSVGTVTPETYLFRSDLEDKWIYGISNFEISEDGMNWKEADNRKSAPLYKQNPLPLKIEEGEKKTIWVRFFKVHNEGMESDISAEKIQGQVQLTFKNKRWLVTGLDLPAETKEHSMADFKR
mgnify:FL=1